MACPTWQYVNSLNDWQLKCRSHGDNKCRDYKLHSKFSGTMSHRHQPDVDSAGMQVCDKIHKWYGELIKHHEFREEVQVTSNEEEKKTDMLTTWTLLSGSRRSRKMDYDDDHNE